MPDCVTLGVLFESADLEDNLLYKAGGVGAYSWPRVFIVLRKGFMVDHLEPRT
jgi:hypothetical protein